MPTCAHIDTTKIMSRWIGKASHRSLSKEKRGENLDVRNSF